MKNLYYNLLIILCMFGGASTVTACNSSEEIPTVNTKYQVEITYMDASRDTTIFGEKPVVRYTVDGYIYIDSDDNSTDDDYAGVRKVRVIKEIKEANPIIKVRH